MQWLYNHAVLVASLAEVVLIFCAAYFFSLPRIRRTKELKTWAKSHGLSFQALKRVELHKRLAALSLKTMSLNGRFSNPIGGEWRGYRLLFFDYYHRRSHFDFPRPNYFATIILERVDSSDQLPQLAIRDNQLILWNIQNGLVILSRTVLHAKQLEELLHRSLPR
jgi:hypothetical protein